MFTFVVQYTMFHFFFSQHWVAPLQWRSQGGHQGHGPSQRQIRGASYHLAPPNNRWAPMGV